MIHGSTIPGGSHVTLAANSIVLAGALALDETEYLVRVGAVLDGLGGADGDQVVRGVLYDDTGTLVAVGEPQTVIKGQAAGWVWFEFPDAEGLELSHGSYRPGIHCGPTDSAARLATGGTGSRTTFTAKPYAAGPPASLTGGSSTATLAAVVVETLPAVRVPTVEDVDDEYLASLPFDLSQRIFQAAGPLRGTRHQARAGWYGTKFDPAVGAFAIVRSDGPLADLVGERIRITRRYAGQLRTVAAWVRDERDFPDELDTEDLLLAARPFFALGNLALDGIDVTVEVLP